jgi:hypothetical protein
MIPMRNGDVATPLTVDMLMFPVHRVAGRLTFVVVIPVLSMKVAVVHEVDVIPVGDGDMAASVAVHMIMFDVRVVGCSGHCFSRRTGFWFTGCWRTAILVTVVERHQVHRQATCHQLFAVARCLPHLREVMPNVGRAEQPDGVLAQLRTSSGRCITAFTTLPPRQSCPTRSIGSSTCANSRSSQSR